MNDEIKTGLSIPVTIIAAEEHRELFKVGDTLAPGKSFARIVLQFPQTELEVFEEASQCAYDLQREAHPELN